MKFCVEYPREKAARKPLLNLSPGLFTTLPSFDSTGCAFVLRALKSAFTVVFKERITTQTVPDGYGSVFHEGGLF